MDIGQAIILAVAIYGAVYYLYNMHKQDKESGWFESSNKLSK